MKKCIILFMSIFMLSACATTHRRIAQQTNWTGRNLENYVRHNGIPTSSYPLSNKQTAYAFKKNCQYDSKIGETLVIVDENDLIISASDTIDCPTYYESISGKLDSLESEISRISW